LIRSSLHVFLSPQIKDGLENHAAINFYECVPLLEYTKDVSYPGVADREYFANFHYFVDFNSSCCVATA